MIRRPKRSFRDLKPEMAKIAGVEPGMSQTFLPGFETTENGLQILSGLGGPKRSFRDLKHPVLTYIAARPDVPNVPSGI